MRIGSILAFATKRRRVSMRSFLILVFFVALLPPTLLLALTIQRSGAADHAAAEQRFVVNSHLIAGMVESALNANAAMIRSLARSGGENDLLAAARHFGGSIRALTPEELTTEVSGRRWTLSNLFDVNPGYGARASLSMPLGNGHGAVTLVSDAAALTRNIDLTSVGDSNMLVAVVDGNGRIVARSVQQDTFIGRPVPNWQALLDVGADDGIFDAQTLEGDAITFGFSKIAGTPGWAVVIGVPKAIFDARWSEPIAMLIAGSILAIAGTLLLSWWLATRINEPISAMVQRSRDIAMNREGALAPLPPTSIAELDELQRAQSMAHARLAERASELALSGQRYRAIAKAGALVTWHRDLAGNFLAAEGWRELTGQAQNQAEGHRWLDRIHPDDLPVIRRNWAIGRRRGDAMDFEMRVQTASGDWIWVHTRAAPITDAEGRTIEWIGTLENIDLRKRQHLHVSHLAYHDALTGLPNRVMLEDQLQAALGDLALGRNGALLYVDLDRFKLANDTYGHATGDELLRKVADRLRRVVRPNDLVARLGGDEFAIVLRDVNDLSFMVGTRIVQTLSNTFEIDGHAIEIGASVGIAPITPESGDLAQIVWQADAALYQAKAGGRNRCNFYAPPTELKILA